MKSYIMSIQLNGAKPVAAIGVPDSSVAMSYTSRHDDMPLCVVHSSEADYLYCGNWVGMTTQTKNQILVGVAIEKFNLMAESNAGRTAERIEVLAAG